MTALIVLGCIFAYLLAGGLIASWDMQHLWSRARNRWYTESNARGDVGVGTGVTVLLWPFRLPQLVMIRLIERSDPKRLEQELRDREAKIAELERELRIGRRS